MSFIAIVKSLFASKIEPELKEVEGKVVFDIDTEIKNLVAVSEEDFIALKNKLITSLKGIELSAEQKLEILKGLI